MRVLLAPGLACAQVKLVIVALLAVALRILTWSRESRDMADFRLRHTLWHVVSVAALTWLARVDGLGLHNVPLVDLSLQDVPALVERSLLVAAARS